ncbi:MAG: glycosyl hydrolase, partial [Bacteroidota bacterium]
LYAGTEYGMYVSRDNGANWISFQLNLPVVPITDLTIKDNNLIVATQGRGFYVLDELSLLQQYDPVVFSKALHVFEPDLAWRFTENPYSRYGGSGRIAGENPSSGAVVPFYLSSITDSTKCIVSIFDKNKKLIRRYGIDEKEKLDWNPGMNEFVWDLRYPSSDRAEGMVLWNGVPSNFIAPPGEYTVRIHAGNDSADVSLRVLANPNYSLTQEGYEQQFALLNDIQNKFNEVQKAIKDVRTIRSQIQAFTKRLGVNCPKEVTALADNIIKQLTAIEEVCYQTKAKSSQDVLNYPIRLNDKLSGLFDVVNSGVNAPSAQAREVYQELSRQADEQINKLKSIQSNELIQLNKLIREKELPVIGLE